MKDNNGKVRIKLSLSLTNEALRQEFVYRSGSIDSRVL
jgi:flagellar basal body-associated protein FliL